MRAFAFAFAAVVVVVVVVVALFANVYMLRCLGGWVVKISQQIYFILLSLLD